MTSSVEIDAAEARAWQVLSDARRWPDWSNVCTEVWDSPESDEWSVGHGFGFKLRMAGRQVPFNVSVSRVERGRLIEWRSTKYSITAIRTIAIEARDDRCRVTDSKLFSSWLLPIRFAYPRWLIRRMTESWLLELKTESELAE